MAKYAKLAELQTPQSEPLNERQVQNNAGGFVFAIDNFARLDRFLILGSDSNTYYQNAKALTRENSKCVEECYARDYQRTVNRIEAISQDGRAARNDAAIWALAIGAAHGDVKVRQAALGALTSVCRTSTHLFQFLDNCRSLGKGWGRAMKRAVANWYSSKSTESVGYQMIKYRSREGYTHKRALELAHVPNEDRKPLYAWAKGKSFGWMDELPGQVQAHNRAMTPETKNHELYALIKDFKLPWEAIPTEAKTDPLVWHAMLPDMGLTALIRNLGAMTSYETLKPLNADTKLVVERLKSADELKKARIHPFTLLQANRVYAMGRGFRGKMEWKPIPAVTDALEDAATCPPSWQTSQGANNGSL